MDTIELKNYAIENGVKFWKIAQKMGLDSPRLSIKFRKGLNKVEQKQFIAAVNALKNEATIKPNADLRIYAQINKVKLYEVAEKMGIDFTSLSRKLRKPFNDADRERFIDAVDSIK
jgi:hypothetical protein